MSYYTHILDWCIEDYEWKNEKNYVSKDDTNMVKITTTSNTFNNEKHFITCISIKSKLCVNLSRVRCYRIRNPSDGTVERLYVANREFRKLSPEWHTLVVRNQFKRYLHENEYDRKNVTLQFEFIFKKNEEIEINRYLQTDVGTHLMNPAFADIMIKTSEGDEVPAHKILLVARSDVFKAHFKHDTSEKYTSTVECPFETKVVKHLLTYIYQDVVPGIEETASKLLVAADFYHFHHLKEQCEVVLEKKLNVDNAVDLLILADKHNASRLRKSALKFVADKKNAVEIVKTEDWKNMYNELVRSIYLFTLSHE